MSLDLSQLDEARTLLGAVYVRATNERIERELTLAKMHVDNARAVLLGKDPDALVHVVQT